MRSSTGPLMLCGGLLFVLAGLEVWYMATKDEGQVSPGSSYRPWEALTSSISSAAYQFTHENAWKEVPDPATGKSYFWNSETGVTTWTRPPSLGGVPPAPPQRAGAASTDHVYDAVIAQPQNPPRKTASEFIGSKLPPKPSAAVQKPVVPPNPGASRVIRHDSSDNSQSLPTVKRAPPPPPASKKVPAPAQQNPDDQRCQIQKDTDFSGGDLPLPEGEAYHISSEYACCDECERNGDCVAWTYVPVTSVCYLKGDDDLVKSTKRGLYSGTIKGRKPIHKRHARASSASAGPAVHSEAPDALKAVFPDHAAAAAGDFPDVTDPEILRISDDLARGRAEEVKKAFKFMWGNYRQRAFGMDELLPKSGKGQNNWGNMGVTLVDSLDTLWLMGLTEDFEAAKEWVRTKLDFGRCTRMMSFFETNIRMVGGLLSAYDLSGDRVFLDKAKDLANRMDPSFDSSSTGIPQAQVQLSNSKTKASWTGSNAVLAEFGTLQVEWRYLALKTHTPKYRTRVEKIYDSIGPAPLAGMYPTLANRNNGRPSGNVYTFGALSDSFYEYLLKMWLQGRKTEPRWRQMYDNAIDGMTKHLLSTSGSYTFVGEKRGGSFTRKMEHLTCFVGGMLALGAVNDPDGADSSRARRDMRNAKAIGYTCYRMYAEMPSGLSPEFVTFSRNGNMQVGSSKFYILRPEAAETLFVLHQLTGHPVFRQWGWEMFEAIRTKCRTTYGFGNYPNAGSANSNVEDRAESFFLAETLKYLYLLQLPAGEGSGGVPLDKYVFNTEAHPLSIFPENWRI